MILVESFFAGSAQLWNFVYVYTVTHRAQTTLISFQTSAMTVPAKLFELHCARRTESRDPGIPYQSHLAAAGPVRGPDLLLMYRLVGP